jgi:hypothetical protein
VGLSTAERPDRLWQQSEPLLAALREKFLACKEPLLPKHPMAEAVNYASVSGSS